MSLVLLPKWSYDRLQQCLTNWCAETYSKKQFDFKEEHFFIQGILTGYYFGNEYMLVYIDNITIRIEIEPQPFPKAF